MKKNHFLILTLIIFISGCKQISEAYFDKGNKMLEQSNYEGAIEKYNKTIKINPTHAEAYNKRGCAKCFAKDDKGAIEDYSKAIDINPNYAEAYYNRGLKNLELYYNRERQIAEGYKKDIYVEKNDPRTYLEIVNDLTKAIEIDFKYVDLYKKNENYAQNNLIDCIVEIVKNSKAIKINPTDAKAFFNRANAKMSINLNKDAIDDFSKALEYNPQYIEAYLKRGILNRYSNQKMEALSDFSKVLELSPNSEVAYYERGKTKAQSGDYRGAIIDYTKAIRINSLFTMAYCSRGNARYFLKNYIEAINDYNNAIEIDPKIPMLYYNRGVTKILLNQKDSGCLDLSKAGELGLEDAYTEIDFLCNNAPGIHPICILGV